MRHPHGYLVATRDRLGRVRVYRFPTIPAAEKAARAHGWRIESVQPACMPCESAPLIPLERRLAV